LFQTRFAPGSDNALADGGPNAPRVETHVHQSLNVQEQVEMLSRIRNTTRKVNNVD
jgi:hypothetical protein